MEKTLIATGKTIELAVEAALTQLGLTEGGKEGPCAHLVLSPTAGLLRDLTLAAGQGWGWG